MFSSKLLKIIFKNGIREPKPYRYSKGSLLNIIFPFFKNKNWGALLLFLPSEENFKVCVCLGVCIIALNGVVKERWKDGKESKQGNAVLLMSKKCIIYKQYIG